MKAKRKKDGLTIVFTEAEMHALRCIIGYFEEITGTQVWWRELKVCAKINVALSMKPYRRWEGGMPLLRTIKVDKKDYWPED